MTPGPTDTVLSDREGLSRQWPVTPCPSCGANDVEDCQCEVEDMNFTAVAGSIYKLRNGGYGLVTGDTDGSYQGFAAAPQDLEAQDTVWDTAGNCAADRDLDLIELVRTGSSAHARAQARFSEFGGEKR